MNAFITGSRAYGRPTRASDVDLVILCSEATLRILKAQGDPQIERAEVTDSNPGTAGRDNGLTASIRFGPLNIIATTDAIAYGVWVKGTEELRDKEQPVTREDAIAHFRALRVKHGLADAEPARPRPEQL